jgi:hypothetical protein
MKKLIFWAMLLTTFSCGTKTNNPISDTEKEKIQGQVKEVAHAFFTACEQVNVDMAIAPSYDSPDYVWIYNGNILTYKDCVDTFKPYFSSQINQKYTILSEKYAFLDNSTVLYTVSFKNVVNFKDGHSTVADPAALLLIFKKIDGKWRIIYGADSQVEKNIASVSSK